MGTVGEGDTFLFQNAEVLQMNKFVGKIQDENL